MYVNVFVDIESFEIKCQTEGTCVRDVVYVIQQTKQFNSDSNTFQMYACLCVDGVRLGMYEMHNTECVCVFLPMFFYRGIVSWFSVHHRNETKKMRAFVFVFT